MMAGVKWRMEAGKEKAGAGKKGRVGVWETMDCRHQYLPCEIAVLLSQQQAVPEK
jgi:hypothetical protein